MAAVSSTHARGASLTLPGSSHVHDSSSWGYAAHHAQDTHRDTSRKISAAQVPTRMMKPADDTSGDERRDSGDGGVLLPIDGPESRTGRSSATAWDSHGHQKIDDHAVAGPLTEEDSKWIHRDKLAKIENEELQAAGLYIPRSRATSKQGRDRSRSALRRGFEGSESGQARTRSRGNSAGVGQRAADVVVQPWDLRTPEEIAEEEAARAHVTSSGLSGSRIPVPKTSLALLQLDHGQNGGTQSDGSGEAPVTKTHQVSRSASKSRANGHHQPITSSNAAAKQPDASPRKNGTRKQAIPPKSGLPTARPKTRSGSGSTRPSTRSGESPLMRPAEGDPPWLNNSYQPDPRLPPDQQLLPTVAKRLQQEKWEKEGKYGDTYDTELRPLNDKTWLKPPEGEKAPAEEENQQQNSEEGWPLKHEQMARSPILRQNSYSTMPKISDKPPGTPVKTSPRVPTTPQMPSALTPPPQQQQPQHPQMPEEKQVVTKSKSGCGCCVVM